jgi:hypothetical protein
MAMKERIIFQPYVSGRGSAVLSGQAVLCRSVEEAQRRAEKAMAGGRAVGAHVIRVNDDAASGEYGEPDYVVALGRVPVIA